MKGVNDAPGFCKLNVVKSKLWEINCVFDANEVFAIARVFGFYVEFGGVWRSVCRFG